VFFDDVGPPWPKHPCTDTSITESDRQPPLLARSLTTFARPKWLEEGWVPMIVGTLSNVESGRLRFQSIRTTWAGAEITIYLKGWEVKRGGMYHVKRITDERFSICELCVNAENAVRVRLLDAFSCVTEVRPNIPEPSATIHDARGERCIAGKRSATH
jgi:hypothetical protein